MSQSRPQFPHQHNEVGELDGLSRGLSNTILLGFYGLPPPGWSQSTGAMAGRKSCQVEGGLSCGWSQAVGPGRVPHGAPTGKQFCCVEKARCPLD